MVIMFPFFEPDPSIVSQEYFPLDVALFQVSPPDHHGYCSLGTSVDMAKAAVEVANIVVAQIILKCQGRTVMDSFIGKNDKAFVWEESDLPEVDYSSKTTDAIIQIGKNVASLSMTVPRFKWALVPYPDQVVQNLNSHKNLGIHTEMLSDGVIPSPGKR